MSLMEVKANEPVTFVIFGATGDLTRRKLLPALYTLFRERALPEQFTIIGFARREYDNEEFCELMGAALREHSRLPADDASLKEFCSHLLYHRGDLSDPAAFQSLNDRFTNDSTLPANRLLYLSISSDMVDQTVHFAHNAGLITPANQTPWTRVIIEKPFGRDLETAKALNQNLLAYLAESQIYRIDHYLGKETVQNILSFRFANTIFEPVFNRTYVDHIQITAAETVGMESGRGAFYDRTGALRDMVANHLFQLLCLVTMEPPDGLNAAAIRAEKMKILHALQPAASMQNRPGGVFGQYAKGDDINAFREEDRVSPDSQTETFVALRMEINNWRWAGVPIYLRTGKRMSKKTTEIAVQFRIPAMQLFQHVACEGDVCDLTGVKPNTLIFRIQPDEGIFLQVSAKRPSMQLVVESVDMDFSYSGKWDKELPEAYERLLLDALRGDPTLFTRSDEVESEWQVIDAIWKATEGQKPVDYAPGSWGPTDADQLIAPFSWRNEQ
ncbi:glucose-6-phosphate dehydrogenase [Tichowtungia aerotolerans]|uniref:Glucose-6-phosphate 1-dehydrogenase n=1 Tax=Tichowtungia aerotolerans TaxID=2697043 RepID=A0A6P1MDW7_9BACT|nr:glucose-6-phosphate dehydrogenase [Tichowtungia aerotolerans]QHI70754.1 glucose-6-phosphate dehydrogenase [Tichowtungia aerotolerans]